MFRSSFFFVFLAFHIHIEAFNFLVHRTAKMCFRGMHNALPFLLGALFSILAYSLCVVVVFPCVSCMLTMSMSVPPFLAISSRCFHCEIPWKALGQIFRWNRMCIFGWVTISSFSVNCSLTWWHCCCYLQTLIETIHMNVYVIDLHCHA